GFRHHRSIARDEIKRLLPFAALGMLLGVTLLANAPQRWLLLALGLYTLCVTAWSLWGPATARQVSTAMAPPLGTAGGVFAALFGAGGPLYSAYLVRRINDKNSLRATTSAVIFSTGIVRLLMFLVIGLYAQPGLWLSALLLLPCALLGFSLGSRLHAVLPARRVVQAVWGLLLLSGTSLVLRSVFPAA
ncbi:MAG: sulfite exporter TauE/SafE family protein, partial [Rubrivivax sp.]